MVFVSSFAADNSSLRFPGRSVEVTKSRVNEAVEVVVSVVGVVVFSEVAQPAVQTSTLKVQTKKRFKTTSCPVIPLIHRPNPLFKSLSGRALSAKHNNSLLKYTPT